MDTNEFLVKFKTEKFHLYDWIQIDWHIGLKYEHPLFDYIGSSHVYIECIVYPGFSIVNFIYTVIYVQAHTLNPIRNLIRNRFKEKNQ